MRERFEMNHDDLVEFAWCLLDRIDDQDKGIKLLWGAVGEPRDEGVTCVSKEDMVLACKGIRSARDQLDIINGYQGNWCKEIEAYDELLRRLGDDGDD